MKRFIQELRTRHVFTVGAAYAVVAWVVLQVAATVLPIYSAPAWILPTLTTLLILGFPVAMLLAWAYEITPQGVKRTGTTEPEASAGSDDDALALPAGPSIAVLPFQNLSADTGQELFAQAMTNDIATGLTQTSALRVVASGGAGRKPGEDMDVAAMGRELGARYLLQGTVNRLADQLRVSARLTDTQSNQQLWSARFDEDLTAKNLFGVQDAIREQIVATLGDMHGVIFSKETEKNLHRPTGSLDAYECLSVALAYDKVLTEPYHLRAREALERAVAIDPDFDQAWSHLSWIYTDEEVFGYNPLPKPMERALKAARHAVELVPGNYHSHWLLARVHYFSGNRDQFFAEAEKSLALNSNDATTVGLIGCYMLLAGQWDRGVALVKKAQVLNPKHPDYLHWFMSAADIHNGDYAAALAKLRRMSFTEWPMALLFLISVNTLCGNRAEAERHLEALQEQLGQVTLEDAEQRLQRMIPFSADLVDTVMGGLKQVMASRS